MFTRSLRSSAGLLRSTPALSRPFSSSLPTTSSFLRPSSPHFEASKVSSQPANADLKEMGQSAKEEAQNVGRALAEAVAGANDTTSQTAPKKDLGAGGLGEEIVRPYSLL